MSKDKLRYGRLHLGVSDIWVIAPLALLALGLITLRLAFRLTRETGASLWSKETFVALMPWVVACIALVFVTAVAGLLQFLARRRKEHSRANFDGNDR